MTRKVFQHLDDLAPASRAVSQYLANWIGKPRTVDRIKEYLLDDTKVRHDHLVYHLFALLLESPRKLPPEITSVARLYAWDPEKSIPMRSMAMSVAAHNRDWAVIAHMRSVAVSRHVDSRLRRGALAALARADSLDDTTAQSVSDDADLARTTIYLQSADVLPSIVSPAPNKLRHRVKGTISRSKRP
jgi:hypothetical protein